MKRIWIAIVAGILLMAIASIAWPIVRNARRPSQLTFTVARVYTTKSDLRATMTALTRHRVVSEGPCEDGGILSQQTPQEIAKYLPGLRGYDSGTTTIVWLYGFKPVEVRRWNDIFGDDIVVIVGKPLRDKNIYAAIVPRNIVEERLHWVLAKVWDE